jgi:hypothetical protein
MLGERFDHSALHKMRSRKRVEAKNIIKNKFRGVQAPPTPENPHTTFYNGAVPSASLNMPSTIVACRTLCRLKRARIKVFNAPAASNGCNLFHLEGGAGD